jgi:hypothetical protein
MIIGDSRFEFGRLSAESTGSFGIQRKHDDNRFSVPEQTGCAGSRRGVAGFKIQTLEDSKFKNQDSKLFGLES